MGYTYKRLLRKSPALKVDANPKIPDPPKSAEICLVAFEANMRFPSKRQEVLHSIIPRVVVNMMYNISRGHWSPRFLPHRPMMADIIAAHFHTSTLNYPAALHLSVLTR